MKQYNQDLVNAIYGYVPTNNKPPRRGRKLTLDQLRGLGAPSDVLRWFYETFGTSVRVTPNLCQMISDSGHAYYSWSSAAELLGLSGVNSAQSFAEAYNASEAR